MKKEQDIIPALKEAMESNCSVFIDFVVESFEMVYPWVLAGQPLNKVLLSNDQKVC